MKNNLLILSQHLPQKTPTTDIKLSNIHLSYGNYNLLNILRGQNGAIWKYITILLLRSCVHIDRSVYMAKLTSITIYNMPILVWVKAIKIGIYK